MPIIDTASYGYSDSMIIQRSEVKMRIHCRFQPSTVFRWFCSNCMLFGIVWTLGLILGAFLAPQSGDPFFSLMRPYFSGRVSIVSHLIMVCLPLMLAAYAVYIHKPKLLLFVAFLKAFHFSFCSCLLDSCFGTAVWLLRFLFQFADIFAVPVFCWFCIRQLSGNCSLQKKDLVISAVLTLLFAVVDAVVIAPFLTKLINI